MQTPETSSGNATAVPLRVTVIFTVLNEAGALPRLLDSLAAQTRPPDEVIVCDGGSRDATLAILRAEDRFPLQVIEAPGANISRGRNLAIAAAGNDAIVCTDAGVRMDTHWLENITRGFTTTGAQWIGGFFLPDPHGSPFEVAMSATVLPEARDISPATFLPSSRSVAYLKAAWECAGGYPEWLDYCEDLILDFKLKAIYGQCLFAPDAVVYFQPRTSLRSFYRQYYLYARGDGKANLWLKRHLARYATYCAGLPVLLAGSMLVQDPVVRTVSVVLLILGIAVYLRTPYRRLIGSVHWRGLATGEKIMAALLIPLIRATGDVAKMMGYPVGSIWRLRYGRKAPRPADVVQL